MAFDGPEREAGAVVEAAAGQWAEAACTGCQPRRSCHSHRYGAGLASLVFIATWGMAGWGLPGSPPIVPDATHPGHGGGEPTERRHLAVGRGQP